MNRINIIEEIKLLNADIKINLECCKIIFSHFNKKKKHYLKKFIPAQDSYLCLLLTNHLQIAILTLNSLLNPQKGEKTTEISPFNHILDVKNLKKLRLLKKKFTETGLHEYRNTSIAHKLNIEKVKNIKYFYANGEKQIYYLTKRIFLEFNTWLKKEFIKEPPVRTFEKAYTNDLINIMNFINNFISIEYEKHRKEAEKFALSIFRN